MVVGVLTCVMYPCVAGLVHAEASTPGNSNVNGPVTLTSCFALLSESNPSNPLTFEKVT